ncbi:acyl-CoA reductase [Ancylomarina euxinus]|uniref:Acyl-CoA reductase n=1 Tax=Ancylomarina euxinus TaxID=2283627 RepID=A0A425Y5N6_9BACT|nr:acyl-CoA reductase [Ancylomarina euxinus]MCZ4694257.1 acyl-CoA reductase [Ancylomarina euxinus]MUP14411.1 acyl-CoA reductase [Ancylomarina euxinus]RRG23720.1 acyl-CoA reductase [Ancylomarina euxinus]
MNRSERIEAFVNLGQFLEQFKTVESCTSNHPLNEVFYAEFENLIENAYIENAWFTPAHVRNSIQGICSFLDLEKLNEWCSNYKIPDQNTNKRVAVIMAGNIPMVGFHDMLSVLISGHHFIGKLSSKDNRLLDCITKLLGKINPEFKSLISFKNEQLKGNQDFDAIIATGSNNSARYFEAYFSKYPHIIRRNRNSVAIITGKESQEEIHKLGQDVFQYFGLGCRNVSKLYVPENYDITQILDIWQDYAPLLDHNKYANNHDYQRSLYLMNAVKHFDNGFLLVKEDVAMTSPIAVLHYEHYRDIDQVKNLLKENSENIQCIVGQIGENTIPFGKAQQPNLNDYADNIDTMNFLSGLNS